MSNIQPLSVISAILVLASCTSAPMQVYEGPEQPDDRTALISVPRNNSDRTAARVRILSVDTPQGDSIPAPTASLRILPRATCIEARATTTTLDNFSAELCFEVFAGRHYEVRALTEGSRLPPQLGASGGDIQITRIPEGEPFNVTRLFVIDVATREVVAVAEP